MRKVGEDYFGHTKNGELACAHFCGKDRGIVSPFTNIFLLTLEGGS